MSRGQGRGIGRPFPKGVSGNPHGRPVETEERREALAMVKGLSLVAVERLKELLFNDDTPPRIRLKVCEIILDYALGKPKEMSFVEVRADGLSDICEEIRAAVAQKNAQNKKQ